MRAKLLVPGIAVGLLLLAGCEFEDFGGLERYHEDFHYNYPMSAGGRLSVEGFNGAVEVSTWDQPTVDISGTKFARTQEDAGDLKIQIDHTSSAVSIRAVRPNMRHGNYGARFAIKVPRGAVLDHLVTSNGAIRTDDGVGPARMKTSNGHVEVRGLKGSLTAESSNGPIEAQDVEGSVEVHTSNGHVRLERVQGAVEATTSNSSVKVLLDKLDGSVKLQSSNGPIDLTLPSGVQCAVRAHTSNNSITIHLPGEVNARLIADTSNGSITSDFEMRFHGEIGKRHVEGTLGTGGPLMDLSSSNGSIRVVR
jgi:DUF4097 and DUF4098 domain-containing protein YvlB